MIPTPTPFPFSTPLYQPEILPTDAPVRFAQDAVGYWNMMNQGGTLTMVQVAIVVILIVVGIGVIMRKVKET